MDKNNCVWVLEEGVNAYDQEGDYTRYIWKEKPTMDVLAKALGLTFPGATDEATLHVVNCWKGDSIRLRSDGSHWILKTREYGVCQ